MRLRVCLFLSLGGCAATSPPAHLAPLADDEQCEAAANYLETHHRAPATASRVGHVVAVPASYLATGVGYAADVVLITTASVVIGGAVCSPLLVLDVLAGGNGEASAECLVRAMAEILTYGLPGVGEAIYAATERWRCNDMTLLSEDLRRVAACYAKRDAPGDRQKARAQLALLHDSERIYRCVSNREREAIDGELAALTR